MGHYFSIITNRKWKKALMRRPPYLYISYNWQNGPKCQFHANSLHYRIVSHYFSNLWIQVIKPSAGASSISYVES